jgi:hypothetical protein
LVHRASFKEEKLVLGENGIWHTTATCLWQSPFTLTDFQDVSTIYNGLEDFFVRRLKVNKASPSMLINEVKRMAKETSPQAHIIRTRLVEIGMILARTPIEDSVSKSLESLKDAKFLPKKLDGGAAVLVGVADDFAISDHQRYGDAFADEDVLLDFGVHEVQSLHAIFQHMGMTHRYLSAAVREVSTVGDLLIEDEQLSQQLHDKAYALYW